LRGSRTEGVNFLNRNLTWLQKALLDWKIRRAKRTPSCEHGSRFLFRGEEVTLQVRPHGSQVYLSFGKEVIGPIPPEQNYRATIKAYLRKLATAELTARTLQLAAKHGIKVSRVTIRAQKTRWGSCSCKGAISLNWHLIKTPPFVTDYRQMNHSAKFWNEVERACPNYLLAEKWLKEARMDLSS
jgi:predicted metal-dependent hydrolase